MKSAAKTLALLIDGDNVQLSSTKQIIQFCETYGTLRIKRAYGDWKQPPLSAHCQTLTDLSIKRVQQDRVGKNATDFRLAMDVASMLDKGAADTYFIASSDADFTAVCARIRQQGAKVIGIGSKSHASSSLRKSCNAFFTIEAIVKQQPQATSKPIKAPKATKAPKPKHSPILDMLIQAHQQTPQDDGWVHLGRLGNMLRQIDQQFDERFASKRLSTWLKSFPHNFEVDSDRVRMK